MFALNSWQDTSAAVTAAPAPFHSPHSNCTTSHSCPASWHSTHWTPATEGGTTCFQFELSKNQKGMEKKIWEKKKNPVILYNYENVDSRTTHDYASKPSSWNDKIHGWIPFREWFFSQLILCIIFWN